MSFNFRSVCQSCLKTANLSTDKAPTGNLHVPPRLSIELADFQVLSLSFFDLVLLCPVVQLWSYHPNCVCCANEWADL